MFRTLQLQKAVTDQPRVHRNQAEKRYFKNGIFIHDVPPLGRKNRFIE
jgi:hypothetical protein